MEENNNIKTANVINLPSLNIKNQLNISLDTNTNLKQILNVEAHLIDHQVEAMQSKAIVKGTMGVKLVYIDTDNMCSTISESVSFNETLHSEYILSNCDINVTDSQFGCEFTSDGQSVRILIDGNIEFLCNLNYGVTTFQPKDNLITKKSVIQANSCVQQLNKEVNFDFDFKLGSKINKILCCDSKVVLDETKCYDGYIVICGHIYNNILYELETDGGNVVKILNNSTPFKCEVEAASCDAECMADVCAHINLNSTQISTDIGENDTQFNFEYCVVVSGYIYRVINMDIVDDAYSLDNDIEIISNRYELCKKSPFIKSCENIDAEITLADELNVDEILGMINTCATITKSEVKDTTISVEGVINGNLIYLDENKEIKQLQTQLPYSVNLKHELNGTLCAINLNVVPSSCKCKIKRGNVLMLDYEICVSGCVYTKGDITLIDNIKYGKPFSYGDIAFQIYVAHANEPCWELCKRLHITQEQLIQYNKENPATYSGGEKIIVYR